LGRDGRLRAQRKSRVSARFFRGGRQAHRARGFEVVHEYEDRGVVITLFAAAFGFVEASVVVYLRAATGLLPGYAESLADVRRSQEIYQPAISISQIPHSLVTTEVCREAATMIMLTMVALLAASTRRDR